MRSSIRLELPAPSRVSGCVLTATPVCRATSATVMPTAKPFSNLDRVFVVPAPPPLGRAEHLSPNHRRDLEAIFKFTSLEDTADRA